MQVPLILVGAPTDPAENNCAGPDSGLVLAPLPSTASEHWQIASSLYRAPLSDEYELVCAPQAGSHVLALNTAARAVLDSFASPRPIDCPSSIPTMAPEAAVGVAQRLAVHRLLAPVDAPANSPAIEQPTTLTAWLHVTNACNLRCTYCYVAKSDEAMDEQTGRAAVDAVFRAAVRNGFRAVKLKYAGGEATLNFGLVQTLHEHAAALAHRYGLALHEAVLSNGVALSTRMIAFIRDAGMRLMISLDGVGAAHDQQRVFVNGRGSFEHVSRAIDRALAAGLSPDLSVTVTGRNAAHLPEVVTFALDRQLRFNLNFYRENDCSAHIANLRAEHEQIITGMRAAFAVIATRVPRFRVIDGLVDRSAFNAPHTRACGAGHTYLVIDPGGRVSRCQMELDKPVTSITNADPLHTIRLEPIGFRNLSVDEKEGCRDCTWRYWCGGGCSLLTYRSTGRSDVKSPYCDVYTALYPDVLKLEGLRLLTWGATEGARRDVFERWA